MGVVYSQQICSRKVFPVNNRPIAKFYFDFFLRFSNLDQLETRVRPLYWVDGDGVNQMIVCVQTVPPRFLVVAAPTYAVVDWDVGWGEGVGRSLLFTAR